MCTSLLPASISQLHDYIGKVTAKPVQHCAEFFAELYQTFESYMLDQEKIWFKKEIIYTDEHIGNNLFGRHDYRRFSGDKLKIHMYACRSSIRRIKTRLDELAIRGRDSEVRSFLSLLDDYIEGATSLLEIGTYLFEGFYPDSVFYKRSTAYSVEIIDAARALFHGTTLERRLGGFVIQPTAVFLIRQSIEIRIKNALGIASIRYNNEHELKVPYLILLKLIEKKKNFISFPITGNLIRKIYEWSNQYIHSGEVPPPWMVEWALHLLEPLFASATICNQWSRYGSVVIDRGYYMNDLRRDILLAIADHYPKIYAPYIRLDRLGSPEALLKK